MKLLLLSVFLFAGSLAAHSQITGRISGEIRGGNGSMLAGAAIILSATDDTTKRRTVVTGEDGRFKFSNLPQANYLITVTYTGHSKYASKVITIDSARSNISLPVIIMQSGENTLKEVVVTSQKKLLEVKIDRTIVNVEAMIGAAGADALEVLSRSPGVMIDMNGSISLDGKRGVLVLIDERPIYMSAQDLADYLRSLPAGALDRLELMSNPPAKYDAAGGAIINIVLKKNKTAGFNGNAALGYTQGVYARKNGSVNLNYRNKNVNIFGNLSLSDDRIFLNDDTRRYFYKADHSPDNFVFLNNHIVNTTQSWNSRAGMDYFLSSKTTFGILITGNTRPKTDLLTYIGNQYNNLGKLDSTNAGYTSTDTRWNNIGINLNFQHKLDSAGRTLSVDIDHIAYRTVGSQPSENNSYAADGSLKNSNRILLDLPTTVRIYSAKIDFTMPFTGGRFDAGIKSSYVKNDNEAKWFNQSGNNNIPDFARTNHFIYSENIRAAYLNLVKDWSRWSFQFGLRFENSHATGHQLANPIVKDSSFARNFTNAFPSMYLLYKLDKNADNTLKLSYNTRTRRPGYQQLNPFLLYRDRYTYTAGNPNLSPEFSYNFGLEYHYKQFFGLAVGYAKENGFTYPITQASGDLFITRPQNVSDRQTAIIIPNFNLSPFKWWNLNAHVSLLYFFKQGSINGIAVPDTYINEFEISNQLRFKKGWSAELTGFFPGKQSFGQSQGQSFYRIGAGVQKNLMNNNAILRLKVDDFFGTGNHFNSRTIAVNQVDIYNTRENDTRRVGISFSYKFGKDANARKRKKDKGGAEEESGRVN
jgi:hypothetical protein